jgi:hypothetical protein
MAVSRIAGEEFFPSKARKFPSNELPETLLKLLQANKLAPAGRKTSKLDLLTILKHINIWQEAQSKQKPMGKPGIPPSGKPRVAGPGKKGAAPIRSPGLLMELRYAITDFLMDTLGPKPFIPVKKKGRDQWITMGWAETNFVRTWVSVVDSENRDISDWNQQRVTNRDGTYTAVLAKDFYRLTRDRAQVVRMWLPALGLAVLFTRDGSNPNSGVTPVRSRNRELKCFPLQALWEGLGVLA